MADAKLETEESMGALMRLAFAACTADVAAWEEVMDLPEEEREQLHTRSTPGQARVLRRSLAANQPRTQMPKIAKPQFSAAEIGETVENAPRPRRFGQV